VPALTGLGAPYWDPYARGALLGLTRDTTRAHVVRATLEAVAYQTKDLWEAFRQDYGQPITQLKVDGGMVKNDWMLQFLADMLACKVDRPKVIETTASGAAFLAGLGLGIFKELQDINLFRQVDQIFEPNMPQIKRDKYYRQWKTAIQSVLLHAQGVSHESHGR
jgi:glycerol kinase